jgi:hypothetical protein
MMTEHRTTLAMLDGIDRFVDGVGKELMGDFRDLPTFRDKRHRAELITQLRLFSRVMLLERCDKLPVAMRTASVELKIAGQREIVRTAEVLRQQSETAFGHQGLPDTLESIGWTTAPEEWGPAPWDLIQESARPFVHLFDDFGIIESVPDLWAEGVTPADMPSEYCDAMREQGYLPPFNEDCDVRCEWVAFFLEGGTGATDEGKWQRVFGMVPRWDR